MFDQGLTRLQKMLQLIDMPKNSTIYGACIGLCPRTSWLVLLAVDNSMLHDTIEAKSRRLNLYWSLIQARLYCVNARTMKQFTVTHDANDPPIKEQALKLNLKTRWRNSRATQWHWSRLTRQLPTWECSSPPEPLSYLNKTYVRQPAASPSTT